jgi:ABC-type sugar transport system permease subunit
VRQLSGRRSVTDRWGADDAQPQSRWRPSTAFWFLLPAGAVLAFVYLGPLAYAVHASFTAWSLTLPGSDRIYVGLENYQDVLGSREYWRAVTVTLSYALSAVLLELVLGTLFALLLNLDFFARSLFRSLMVIPMVLTPAVIGIFFKLMYEQESGLFNYYRSPGSASIARSSRWC